MRLRDEHQVPATGVAGWSTRSLTSIDPDELAVELTRRRHDRAQRLAAATVKRLARARLERSTDELSRAG